jgi:hypothetical protein
MSKLFKIAGVSRLNKDAGFKLRVANGKLIARQRVLERNGHVDIQLFDLPHEMSKPKILAWFALDKPSIAAKLDGKAPKAAEVTESKVVELTKEAKLLIKRAKDAARKREKRAAAKLAMLQSKEKVDAEQASI